MKLCTHPSPPLPILAQIDPLLEHMSAREQLHMFARIKGVPEHMVLPGVTSLLQRVGLPITMADRASGTLSGGNKRKVALAIALSGRPAAVLLDEPSSGARKQAHTRIQLRKHDRHENPQVTSLC